ncbi:MAG TPA: spore coat U domain-containing protein [Thiopseudomonas sp.]|nr:spore coat U domain-containing protein [Thiopseudomonas sp.]
MNQTLLRSCALLLLGVGVFAVRPAYAVISCSSVSLSDFVFGDVDPQSSLVNVKAELKYTCRNSGLLATLRRSAKLCFSVGEPGAGSINPRQMKDVANNTLNFQIYQNFPPSIIWGSQFHGAEAPLKLDITLEGGLLGGQSITYTRTIHGRVFAGQTTAIPGSYINNYSASDTAFSINQDIGKTAPEECSNTESGNLGPFMVSATVVKKCTVSASTLNFGNSVGLLTNAVNASTTLVVQCSNTTPYNVGLSAGQNSGDDINARKMVLGNKSVDYQLYRDPARTQVWGNTVNSNTVAGTGIGTTQILTVYGGVPAQTTPPAGTYSDTIVVTVTY